MCSILTFMECCKKLGDLERGESKKKSYIVNRFVFYKFLFFSSNSHAFCEIPALFTVCVFSVYAYNIPNSTNTTTVYKFRHQYHCVMQLININVRVLLKGTVVAPD